MIIAQNLNMKLPYLKIMIDSNKNINQKTGDTKGDSTISNISDSRIQAGRDINLQIGSNISNSKPKKEGFELEIDPMEKLMIRLGRYLLSKLGIKGFIGLLIILFGGSGGYIGYNFLLMRENPMSFSDNITWFFIAILVISFTLIFLGYAKESYCDYCKKPYLTVPMRREVTDSMKYKDGELYNEREIRFCENCKRTIVKKRTRQYTPDENNI